MAIFLLNQNELVPVESKHTQSSICTHTSHLAKSWIHCNASSSINRRTCNFSLLNYNYIKMWCFSCQSTQAIRCVLLFSAGAENESIIWCVTLKLWFCQVQTIFNVLSRHSDDNAIKYRLATVCKIIALSIRFFQPLLCVSSQKL